MDTLLLAAEPEEEEESPRLTHVDRAGKDSLVCERLYDNIHYRSKVWGHPDNFMFSLKTHTVFSCANIIAQCIIRTLE